MIEVDDVKELKVKKLAIGDSHAVEVLDEVLNMQFSSKGSVQDPGCKIPVDRLNEVCGE